MTVSDDDFQDDDYNSPYESNDSGDESDNYMPDEPPKKVRKVAQPKKRATKATASIASPDATITESPKPPAKRKSPAKKNSASPAVSEPDTTMTDAPTPRSTASTKGDYDQRTIEEIYQKKTQLEHILLRPDTYIGSTEAEELEMWVFDSEEDAIKKKKIRYVPGLYKIVDEILVNAADNKIRDPSMNQIKVIIDRSQNLISIQNNGRGIPIDVHKDEQVYVPELIFGHLLTSSNYNDNEKKVTGGRNGYGAKLCNIFSTEFTVETADKERQLKYRQVFRNNMSIKGEPKVTSNSRGEEYTRISFKPDLSKFGMSEMDEDFEALIKKRVYDLAGCVNGVNVYLNGTKIPVKGFLKYTELYTKSMDIRNAEGKKPIIHDTQSSNSRWQVSFAVSDGQFNQISFVNSICTAKGGTHVNYIADQIVKAITPIVQKKSGSKTIRPFQIKNHMCIFLNCLIENPSFDSQTKENMTLRPSSFGSTYTLSDKFIKDISTSGLIDNIVKWVKFKEEEQMSKADSGKMTRRLRIPKLEDANWAGVKPKNKNCTLILTEGDSAKTLVLSGLSVVGRDEYGVFPLRGKLLNVRDCPNAQIMSNAEITNIKAILGLKHGKTYTSVDDLRYGKLMIMTDQDHDGSHIKGLLINFIDQMFPSLLDIPGFLLEFITPIIRCRHKRTKQDITFFTIPEYITWAEEHNKRNEWEPKYFKGLGTSDKSDARKYFSNLDIHKKEFIPPDKEDRALIEMAFSKKKVTERKDWLTKYDSGTYLDHSVSRIKIADFVNMELMQFSMADNIRSIPSVVDGFKPGQRKVLFGSIKRGKNSEIKVAQLANYVAGITQYHHGEASVAATVINMAQDFVGSNNINILHPAGQFGSRHEGGKAAASPRYLFTRLTKIARYIFHPDDDEVLEYLIEESKSIEPKWYMPILPMVLVNGADGIGTGWSTTIPNYNPKDIVDNLMRMMNDEEVVSMKPWFRGFKGDIIPSGSGKYTVNGIASVEGDGKVKVTELPVRLWTDNFKDHLELLREPKDKKPEVVILDYSNNSTDSAVEFTIDMDNTNLNKAEDIGLLKVLKITSSISTNNIVCFDKDGKIKKYETPEQVLREFYDLRLEYYQLRKNHLIYVLQDEYDRLDNKSRFIELVLNGDLVYHNRKEEDVIADMQTLGLKRIYPRKKKNVLVTEDDEGNQLDTAEGQDSGYDYLFTISVRGFTTQKVADMRHQRESKLNELETVKATSPKDFWRQDLNAFLEQWEAILAEDEKLAQQAKPLASAKTTKRKRGPPKAKAPKAPKKEAED
ncbi:DNA topoisomerase [Radiomyces spectabilis]|uniref:DNA topoisomerase n=1 Tax=Radiomyces spectabilis TaxID=64574 RepID=UPI00221F6F7F|nr:DNA topoisomerase [Radiomyces spectabilis]KAI8393721.1 DNA topoisomerase [Radiomyces spectabilis]